MDIQDKVAIVTGASSGIGLALAKDLAKAGAKMVVAARSKDKIESLAKELPDALAVAVDMGKVGDIKNLVDKTLEKYGRVDILINNAAQGLRAPVEKIDLTDFKAIMDVNVYGPLLAMQQVIPLMRQQGSGMILNISSRVSKNYFPNLAGYAATKYALNCISLTARQELEADHIIVSVFHPKMTATDFGQNARGTKYVSAAGRPGMGVDTPEQVSEQIIKQIQSEQPEAAM